MAGSTVFNGSSDGGKGGWAGGRFVKMVMTWAVPSFFCFAFLLQFFSVLFCFVWLVRNKQRENCELMTTYSFSDGVWIGGLTSPGPDSGPGLRRRCPSRAARRSLVHRSGWSSIILGLE